MTKSILEGRVAIVTGGGRGIGKAICDVLINSGASVIIADTGGTTRGDKEEPDLAHSIAESYGERAAVYS